MHRKMLQKIAPLWLLFNLKVRLGVCKVPLLGVLEGGACCRILRRCCDRRPPGTRLILCTLWYILSKGALQKVMCGRLMMCLLWYILSKGTLQKALPLW